MWHKCQINKFKMDFFPFLKNERINKDCLYSEDVGAEALGLKSKKKKYLAILGGEKGCFSLCVCMCLRVRARM